ncbi:thylakoid membrane photosystem I accumulation factor [Leptolyngbya sp. AN02str]|uniref:thylakoid membrane photosystem I accumulation factor n=1 Tax=Leptolyngbya sp. AN02str TaxID=3423363 RepID=UPI003D31931A
MSGFSKLWVQWQRWVWTGAIALLLVLGWANPAMASLTDDHYDGDIFPLYAGNGYLVPPKVTLAQAFQRTNYPTVLSFYVDDSSDCKQFSAVLSTVEAYYGKVVDILPIRVDSLPVKDQYDSTEPGYYYSGQVPQTIIFDKDNTILFNEVGNIPYERMDDVLREVFDLLPREESVELKRRVVNEINTELVK